MKDTKNLIKLGQLVYLLILCTNKFDKLFIVFTTFNHAS